MKVEWSCKVGYMDIDPQFQMRLGVLARLLQEAAVTHSEQVGIRSRDLVANGAAWVLNKMAFRFGRLPRFGEDIRVVTWHKGSRGFTATVSSRSGPAVSAWCPRPRSGCSSIW